MNLGADSMALPHAWWRQRAAVRRVVADLVEGELARQRSGNPGRPRPWAEVLDLDQDLGADSLERMALAAALAEFLHLHESGTEDYLLVKRTLGDWVDIAQTGLERFSGQLTFRTSGSSGAPKACPHSIASLWQEACHHGRLFEGRLRILSAVPTHHIYGFLFTVLVPRALGLQAEAVVDIRDSSAAWLARGARPGDLVVGHPDFWQAVARAVPALPADVIGVTSTAPCPDAVSAAVESAGIARLIHVYGSSETAGIGWRSGWRDPYRLFPYLAHSAGNPGRLQRRMPDGSCHELLCQDRLEPAGSGLFRVGPRHDEAVQVGGVNVFASRVAAVLRAHPQVADAAVRLMRPDEGSRLKAYVVPAAGLADSAALLADLRRWIDARLAVHERPKAIRLGDRLPTGESGKPADWAIDTPTVAQ